MHKSWSQQLEIWTRSGKDLLTQSSKTCIISVLGSFTARIKLNSLNLIISQKGIQKNYAYKLILKMCKSIPKMKGIKYIIAGHYIYVQVVKSYFVYWIWVYILGWSRWIPSWIKNGKINFHFNWEKFKIKNILLWIRSFNTRE